MELILKGHIKKEGCGLAGKRLSKCSALLQDVGIFIPPFRAGTINIKLDKPFPTPESRDIIYISKEKIDSIEQGYNEWWIFIPVKKINGYPIPGFIFRNAQHVHGDSGAELVTIDLENNPKFNLLPGQPMELVL